MAKQKESKTTRHKPNLLGAAALLQKQLEKEAKKRAKKRAKNRARSDAKFKVEKEAKKKAKSYNKFKIKFARDPPNICISLQWGKSLVHDDDDILDLPSKLSVHNLCGNNVPSPPSTTTTPSPPSTTTTPQFDPTFQNDEDLKYYLMVEWYNADKNKETDPKASYRIHNHKHWEHIGIKHAPEIHKGVTEYFDFGSNVFENLKKIVHKALRTSVGERYGMIGSQILKVEQFLEKLTAQGLFPTIHASERWMKPINGKKPGLYQTLHEVRFYYDPTNMTPIYAPHFPKGEKQGNYKMDSDMYLV